MDPSDVTTLYKGKGSRQDVENWRGVFQLPVLRNILDRMVYEEEYSVISSNMGCFQVGSQRGRNIRDHLLVLHAICNEVRIKHLNVDIILNDIKQCFDTMWIHETINDLYTSGVKSRNLNILFSGNSKTRMRIKTAFGNTPRIPLNNLIMQGSVPGPIMCSNQMSKLSNKCFKEGTVYMYMNKVPVGPLDMVDDVATISECGTTSGIEVNVKTDTFIKGKKLESQVAKGKCQFVHIGKGKCTGQYYANYKRLEKEDSAKYLADIISDNLDNLYEARAAKQTKF